MKRSSGTVCASLQSMMPVMLKSSSTRVLFQSRRSVLEQEHKDTLQSSNKLAITLHAQVKYKEAEVLHRQILQSETRSTRERA